MESRRARCPPKAKLNVNPAAVNTGSTRSRTARTNTSSTGRGTRSSCSCTTVRPIQSAPPTGRASHHRGRPTSTKSTAVIAAATTTGNDPVQRRDDLLPEEEPPVGGTGAGAVSGRRPRRHPRSDTGYGPGHSKVLGRGRDGLGLSPADPGRAGHPGESPSGETVWPIRGWFPGCSSELRVVDGAQVK